MDLESPISAWYNPNKLGFKADSLSDIEVEYNAELINRNVENGEWRVMGLMIYKIEHHMDMSKLSIYLDDIKLDIYPNDHKTDWCHDLFYKTEHSYIHLQVTNKCRDGKYGIQGTHLKLTYN